jgi:hypothetical protein
MYNQWDEPQLSCLASSQLRELSLKTLRVQLEPADGCQGVLRKCTGLTALSLCDCMMHDAEAATAAIAALPELQRLSLTGVHDKQDRQLPTVLQLPVQLTHLELWCAGWGSERGAGPS